MMAPRMEDKRNDRFPETPALSGGLVLGVDVGDRVVVTSVASMITGPGGITVMLVSTEVTVSEFVTGSGVGPVMVTCSRVDSFTVIVPGWMGEGSGVRFREEKGGGDECWVGGGEEMGDGDGVGDRCRDECRVGSKGEEGFRDGVGGRSNDEAGAGASLLHWERVKGKGWMDDEF